MWYFHFQKSSSITQSLSFNNLPSLIKARRLSSTLPTNDHSTKNVLNDFSSLFSFTSRGGVVTSGDRFDKHQEQTRRFPNRASFHGFSNLPPHHPPPPRLTKQKALNLPSINVEAPSGIKDDRKHPYSPERSDSFENFTQKFFPNETPHDENPTKTNLLAANGSALNIEPPRRHSLYRPSPRIRRIEDEATGATATRQFKSKSLYLEVLNRRSFATSMTFPDDSDDQRRPEQTSNRVFSIDNAKTQSSLRNLSGYATFPKRYKRKSGKK